MNSPRKVKVLPEDVLTLGFSDFRNDRNRTVAADGEPNLVSVWVKPTNDHLLANNGRPRLHKNKHKMRKGIWPEGPQKKWF